MAEDKVVEGGAKVWCGLGSYSTVVRVPKPVGILFGSSGYGDDLFPKGGCWWVAAVVEVAMRVRGVTVVVTKTSWLGG